jgi:hypothetical protein
LDTGLVPIKTWFNGKTTFSHKGSQGNVSKPSLDGWMHGKILMGSHGFYTQNMVWCSTNSVPNRPDGFGQAQQVGPVEDLGNLEAGS